MAFDVETDVSVQGCREEHKDPYVDSVHQLCSRIKEESLKRKGFLILSEKGSTNAVVLQEPLRILTNFSVIHV